MKLEFSRQSVEKYIKLNFHELPPSGSRVFPCRQTDELTDMTKLVVALPNFANAPKNQLKDLMCPGQDSEYISSKEIRHEHYSLIHRDRLHKV